MGSQLKYFKMRGRISLIFILAVGLLQDCRQIQALELEVAQKLEDVFQVIDYTPAPVTPASLNPQAVKQSTSTAGSQLIGKLFGGVARATARHIVSSRKCEGIKPCKFRNRCCKKIYSRKARRPVCPSSC